MSNDAAVPSFLSLLGADPAVIECAAGELVVTSGRIVVCDPRVGLARSPLDRAVPNGRHRVYIGRRAGVVVYSRIAFADRPVRWQPASTVQGGRSTVTVSVETEIVAFVDAGVAAASAAIEGRRRLEDHVAPDPLLAKLDAADPVAHGFANVVLLGEGNAIAAPVAKGNGEYGVYAGLGDDGAVAALVVDLRAPAKVAESVPSGAPSRFLARLARPVRPDERFHVTPRISAHRAEVLMLAEIRDGVFRPGDAEKSALIEEVFALFVPFWRIDLARSDTSMQFASVRIGSLGVPIPHHRTRKADAVWMVSARTAFPYKMQNPSVLLAGDAKPLTASLGALIVGDASAVGWEVIDADVDGAAAVKLATDALGRTTDAFALFQETSVRVDALHFVEYPVWFARYRYRGEASAGGDELFYVGLDAVTGKPITALHPSKLRSGAAKVKRFFGFDE